MEIYGYCIACCASKMGIRNEEGRAIKRRIKILYKRNTIFKIK